MAYNSSIGIATLSLPLSLPAKAGSNILPAKDKNWNITIKKGKKKEKTIQKAWKYVTKSHWLGYRSFTLSSKNKISFKQTEVNNIYRHRKDVNTPPPTNNTIVIWISYSFLFHFYVIYFSVLPQTMRWADSRQWDQFVC